MTRSRQVFNDETLASFAVPIDHDTEGAEPDDERQQQAEREALRQSLVDRLGSDADNHLQPDEP